MGSRRDGSGWSITAMLLVLLVEGRSAWGQTGGGSMGWSNWGGGSGGTKTWSTKTQPTKNAPSFGSNYQYGSGGSSEHGGDCTASLGLVMAGLATGLVVAVRRRR